MRSYQKGFFISEPISNNRFDYTLRKNPHIYVPSLIEGDLNDVQTAETLAIEAMVGSQIHAERGLGHAIFLRNARVPTWICDNHNHAFVFWHEAFRSGYIQTGSFLVHIDQHTDLATPLALPPWNHLEEATESMVETYTNTNLTIADFIVPALAIGLISEALMVTGEDKEGVGTFTWENNKLVKTTNSKLQTQNSIIVDLDLDYFSQGFDENETFTTVRYWLARADIITIATSPLFIEQERAIEILKSLQKELLLL